MKKLIIQEDAKTNLAFGQQFMIHSSRSKSVEMVRTADLKTEDVNIGYLASSPSKDGTVSAVRVLLPSNLDADAGRLCVSLSDQDTPDSRQPFRILVRQFKVSAGNFVVDDFEKKIVNHPIEDGTYNIRVEASEATPEDPDDEDSIYVSDISVHLFRSDPSNG